MKYASLHGLTLSLVLTGCGNLGAFNPEFVDSDGLTAGDADTDADADADSDADADVDTDTDIAPCEPPELWDLGAVGPVAGNISPVYVGITLWGIVENGVIYDYNIDGADGSAYFVADLFDGAGALMCSAIFDASTTSTQSNGNWVTDTGGIVWEGYDFTLNGVDGYTDCPNLDGSLGYSDVRAWVASRSWRVGLGGTTATFAADLQAAVVGGGGNWALDWAPYVVSQYIDVGGPTAVEGSYTMVYPHTCYDLAGTPAPGAAPGAGPVNGYLGSSGSYWIMPVATLP